MEPLHALLRLAEQQHGVIGVEQATSLGLGDPLARQRRVGRFEFATPSVVRVVGTADTAEQRAMVAVLGVGPTAALSHHSAAALWGLPGFALEPFHVTLLRKAPAHETRRTVVHEPRLLLPEHVRRVDNVPVTTPERTLFDLAGARRTHPLRVERALDTAWAEGLVRWRTLELTLEQLARKGRPGIRLMRALLEARGPDHCPPESNLEARFADVLRAAGLTGFERQVDLGDSDWIGRVDFVHRELRIVVEVDHSRWHSSLSDASTDALRDERLRAAGWLVIRVREFDVWHRKDNVIAAVRAAMLARSANPAA